jgi:hypothetical protein
MTIATDIATLLSSSTVQKISFSAESVRISGVHYRTVADAVRTGRIAITIGPMPSGVAAQYDSAGSSLSGGTGGTLHLSSATIALPSQKAAVVHEMTHAVVDSLRLSRSRGLHRTENEAIAYIAVEIYMLDNGIVPGAELRLFRVATQLAKRVISARPHHYTVSAEEMRHLRNAIGQNRHYRHIRGIIKVTDGL